MGTFVNLKMIYEFISELPDKDAKAEKEALAHQNELTKPPGSLGQLEKIAIFFAGWQGVRKPKLEKAQALVFAGNHGVCDQGVNPFPQRVTAEMVANFYAGGAAINQLCLLNDVDLNVIPLSLDKPTADFTQELALPETDFFSAMNLGAEAINLQADVILLGEMGIGNSTVSAAIAASLFGGEVTKWVGKGTGSDKKGVDHKKKIIGKGLKKHGFHSDLRALIAFGGREQAAICGAILAARAASIPVILDGFICTAAASPLYATHPKSLDHCLIGHLSTEPGHIHLLKAMEKSAILELKMRLGEGTGAALALSIVRGALACHNQMATFESAGISTK